MDGQKPAVTGTREPTQPILKAAGGRRVDRPCMILRRRKTTCRFLESRLLREAALLSRDIWCRFSQKRRSKRKDYWACWRLGATYQRSTRLVPCRPRALKHHCLYLV